MTMESSKINQIAANSKQGNGGMVSIGFAVLLEGWNRRGSHEERKNSLRILDKPAP
jgi:hypothetical protein